MTRVPGWICAVAILVWTTPALAQVWQVDPAHSTLAFASRCGAAECSGQFRRFRADIAYDPANLVRAKFDFVVDIASLEVQDPERGRLALGADFLGARKYPRAYFSTVVFRKMHGGRIVDEGELSLRGVIRPVVLDVVFMPHGDTATLDLTARLDRLDFGIGDGKRSGASVIGDAITVHGHLLLKRAK
ncbi:MAG: YceI family protein [Rhodanobacteraceae bacterium]